MTTTSPHGAAPHAAGPDGHGWAPPGPAATPCEAARLIERIVAAVRAGDDPAIRPLLHQLADVADAEALLLLHRRLNEDLHR
ncbi:hypothetical protein OG393_22720 [Streptomyces sp. NBC_01216]|uniref:hypothetical protein n=1 Tax=Streptomyces sp. NBC_01216 TaxID=2903778 RepID=UPI002E1124C9|nr:hypothetical protein OG393_22720 [Streptomyces sp. NBC_01216]